MNWTPIVFGIFFVPILILYCIQRGKQKKAGLAVVISVMIFTTPFIGYFIVEAMPNHKLPCKWCGNKFNEVEYCGVCGKNESGETNKSVQV